LQDERGLIHISRKMRKIRHILQDFCKIEKPEIRAAYGKTALFVSTKK